MRLVTRHLIQLFNLLFLFGWLLGVGASSAEPKSKASNSFAFPAHQSPWKDASRALVIDAYEKNHVDWLQMTQDKRIRAFIGKASDGLPSPYACSGNEHEQAICKKSFQNYFMKQQLYHTRRALTKSLGLKWGAYHLGRPGNPIEQANHFLSFAQPEPDELMAIDIEHDDPEKWISLEDAEIFARHIHARTGRYPVLYTNHDTARKIAQRQAEFPVLSRLPLWYARYRDNIEGVFPMGHWDNYAMWQFSSGQNCGKKSCPYRVKGTPHNIDVNVSPLTITEFDRAWPFDTLVPERLPENIGTNLFVSNTTAERDKPKSSGANNQNSAAGKALTSMQLKQMGVAAIPVPVSSPKLVQTADVLNLLVKIRRSRSAKHSVHEDRKMSDQASAATMIPFKMALDDAAMHRVRY